VLTPLIVGGIAVTMIPPTDQRIIATWAVKTALMADFFMHPQAFLPAHASRFFIDKAPPQKCFVATGAYDGDETGFAGRTASMTSRMTLEGAGYFNAVGVKVPASAPEDLNGYGALLCVGHLILRVVIYEGAYFPVPKSSPPRPTDRGKLHRIWPVHDEAIDWPPNRVALSEEQFFALGTGTSDKWEGV